MSTNPREELEAAVKALEDFANKIDESGVTPTADDVTNLKARMTEVMGLRERVESDAKVRGEVAAAKAFLHTLGGAGEPVKSEKFTADGRPMNTGGKTLGELFVTSEQYGAFTEKYVRGGVIPNQVKGIQSGTFQVDAKTLITGASSTSAGVYVRNDLYAPTTDLVGVRELTVADLVTQGTTASDTVEYVRVTTKTNNAAATAEATTAAAGAISGGSTPRPGRATNVTSAPSCHSISPAKGPGPMPSNSTTLIPAKGAPCDAFVICRYPCCHSCLVD